MNILDGDIIEIREPNYFLSGRVAAVEYTEDPLVDYYVLVDYNANNGELGRIPVRNGALPKTIHHIPQQ